jgi:undecaprenyl diphosphate synthase
LATPAKIRYRSKGRFRVGDLVGFTFGITRVRAKVVEDRGPIGAGGRRLYRVEVRLSDGDTFQMEMPEVELEPGNLQAFDPINLGRPRRDRRVPATTPTPDTLQRLADAGLDPQRLPRHVAVIMDGNGRWAQERGKPRVEGHLRGTQSVRAVVEESCKLGIGQLTLYCLSSENWKRPQAELEFLMALLHRYLLDERAEIMGQNIRFTTIGRRDGLPDEVLAELDENVRLSQTNTGLVLCLAINYGARTELVDAMRALADRVRRGELSPEAIDESAIDNALYTAGMPDPDLLIRTAGEMRVSNFLLWQISYAELWVTDRCWPEFDAALLHEALRDYARRERRFGGLKT